MRRLLVGVLAAVLAAAGLGTAAGAGWFSEWGATAADRADAPPPPSYQARFEGATTVAGLAVVVERQKRRPVAGGRTGYTIAVGNRGTATEQVIIRAVVPPGLARVNVADDGEAGEGFVDWRRTLAPGEASEVELAGSYAAAGRGRPEYVAFTACAHDPQSGAPIACATDLVEVQAAPSAARWWGLSITGFALAAAVLSAVRFLPAQWLALVLRPANVRVRPRRWSRR